MRSQQEILDAVGWLSALAIISERAPIPEEAVGAMNLSRNCLDWVLGEDDGPFAKALVILKRDLERNGVKVKTQRMP